ncbi:MAG: glycoside hydrolase family 3 N-terminal domain-containing protein [Bacteroidales bacterium]|nr:glycoside hydrolase family 3 N-terminal domain-containing protein [Bacteroidales bacterium]
MSRKKSFASLLFIFFFAQSSLAVTPHLLSQMSNKREMNAWVDSVFSTLSLDEQIGQLFMITVDASMSKNNQEKLYSFIQNQKVGGFLFAKSKIETQANLTNLIQSKSRVPLFIALDGEWGLSMRIESTPRFPKNIALGALRDTRLVYEYGREVARECKLMGIQINFAPVLDINNNPDNPVINIRSFGENRERVSAAAVAYSKGLESGHVLSVGKHFPGHGDTSIDSHLNLPIVDLTLSRLDSLELYPFKKYINEGLSGLMVGHLYLPAFDSDTIPASLSSSLVTDLLKNELGFEGLIFTDALVMKAISRDGKSVSVKALQAGNDVLLNPLNPAAEVDSVRQAVARGEISEQSIAIKCCKVLTYKYICGLNHYDPIDTNGLVNRLNTRDSELLDRNLTANSLSLLKNKANIVPIKDLDKQSIAVVSLGEKNSMFYSMTKLYAKTTLYTITETNTVDQVKSIAAALTEYSTILVAVYSDKEGFPERLNQILSLLSSKNRVILSFFTSPFKTRPYAAEVNRADGVLMAYEATPDVQNYAAQLLFGGVEAKGKLSVSIDTLFANGVGLSTHKTRLAYELPESVGLDSRKLMLIDSLVKRAISEGAIPGCQVLVAKDGAVVYNKGFGYFDYANTHPVDVFDVYDIASMTKATATLPALMMLYDQDKFLLRDKLETFIPELKKTDKGDITVKEALFHQSGLPSFIPFNQLLIDPKSYEGDLISKKKSTKYALQIDENSFAQRNFKFLNEYVSDTAIAPYSIPVAENFYINPSFHAVMMKKIVDAKLGSKQKYVYSDLNFMLLRKMVEYLSHTTIDTFLTKNLYPKLGAYSTGYLPLARIDRLKIAPTENDHFFRKQMLIGYPHDELAALSGGVEGNAGLFANANDLAKLCQMYLNDGEYGEDRFVKKETMQIFTQMKSPDSRRGLGFDKPNPEKPNQGPTCDSAPLSTYGHTGFTGTCFWVDPDNHLIYIFLSNRVYPNRWNKKLSEMDTRTLIQEAIYQSLIQNKK